MLLCIVNVIFMEDTDFFPHERGSQLPVVEQVIYTLSTLDIYDTY